MNWNNCYTEKGLNKKSGKKDERSNFQKDYDRIIFSSAFRRLQNKTQVFPLPGTQFVHNRLTHSLEVASVGRSLSESIGKVILKSLKDKASTDSIIFYNRELPYVITAGCLAHDIGNPAFGHSGEEAISHYFTQNIKKEIEGIPLRDFYSEDEWQDLSNFEGNANALRVLTQAFKGKSEFGLGITMTTLASILKYPCASNKVNKQFKHRKKYGYFQSEKENFKAIAEGINFVPDEDDVYRRHPFVYLVEAADDICYNIIDMEDAQKLGILGKDLVSELFLDLIHKVNVDSVNIDRVKKTFTRIGDSNESMAYLRAKCISALVEASAREFEIHMDEILAGDFNSSLIGEVEKNSNALKEVKDVSYNQIYRHPSVMEIEVAGFNVMSELIGLFLPAVLKSNPSKLDQTLIDLIPSQFSTYFHTDQSYLKTMSVLDHISSMTDAYATEIYRKLKGIEISRSI